MRAGLESTGPTRLLAAWWTGLGKGCVESSPSIAALAERKEASTGWRAGPRIESVLFP
jgi:hypothetical protein